MKNNQESEKVLEKEIEEEIDKMSMDELLYLELNPNQYIYSKLKSQIENIKTLEKEVNSMKDEFSLMKFQKLNVDDKLKEQYEKNYKTVNKLFDEKNKLENKLTKNEFINKFNDELKNFNNPDECLNKWKDGKINYNEFKKQFSELGKGKNYYYYKLIYDKIKS